MEIKIKVEQNKHNIDLKMKDSIVVYRESGKQPQTKDVEYFENGEYLVEADDGYVLEEVNVKVNVPIPSMVVENWSFTLADGTTVDKTVYVGADDE